MISCRALQVLYDFGAGSTTATLLQYSSWKSKEVGKVKHHGQFEVKGIKWDATAGAEALDLVLVGELRAPDVHFRFLSNGFGLAEHALSSQC